MIPAVNDTVWFFFRHAHGVPEDIDGHVIELFTGMSEMRCRPAKVVRVVTTSPDLVAYGLAIDLRTGIVDERPLAMLDLEIAFEDEDRIEMPGGVVLRPGRQQPDVLPHDGLEPGKLGRGWPQDRRWADRPHASHRVKEVA